MEGSRGVAPFICKWEGMVEGTRRDIGKSNSTIREERLCLPSKMGVRTYPKLEVH